MKINFPTKKELMSLTGYQINSLREYATSFESGFDSKADMSESLNYDMSLAARLYSDDGAAEIVSAKLTYGFYHYEPAVFCEIVAYTGTAYIHADFYLEDLWEADGTNSDDLRYRAYIRRFELVRK